MLDADDVEKSLSASVRLMRQETEVIATYDLSIEGYWRSFGAMFLAVPAFLIVAAGQWHMTFAPRFAGVVDDALARYLVIQGAAFLTAWMVWPMLALEFTRMLGRMRDYAPYIIAYNWTSVLVHVILAAPMALYLVGWALPTHAFVFTLAFMALIAHFRWFLARAVLGVSSGVAVVMVMVDLGAAALIHQLAAWAVLSG